MSCNHDYGKFRGRARLSSQESYRDIRQDYCAVIGTMANSQPSGGNSASHWIKAVVEEVAPRAGAAQPSFTSTPSVGQSAGSSIYTSSGLWPGQAAASVPSQTAAVGTGSMAGVNPAYMAYYQDYYARLYQQQNNAVATAAASTNSLSATSVYAAPAAAPTTYKSVLISSIPSAPAAAPAVATSTLPNWNSFYRSPTANPAAATTAISPLAATSTATVANDAKKPNPSRFAAATPSTNPAPSTSSAPAQQQQQPASLREFVLKSFATCANDKEREYVRSELQKLISKVTAEGRLHVHKWELEPAIMFPAAPAKLTIDTKAASGEAEGKESGKKRKSRFGEDAPLSPAAPLPSPVKAKTSILLTAPKLLTPQELQMREKRAHRFQQAEEAAPPAAQGKAKKRRHSFDGGEGMDLDLKVV
eukprot:gene35666-43257_t